MEEIIKLGRTDTMTSLEIAEITGKKHAHVMRDIRSLIEQGVNGSNFGLVNYKDKKGELRPMFELTPKGCLILASGYDALLREKIINKLEELEKNRREQYQVPQSFSEALMLAAKQQEKIESNNSLLSNRRTKRLYSSRPQSPRCSQRLAMLIQFFRARRPLQRHRLLRTMVNQQKRSISC